MKPFADGIERLTAGRAGRSGSYYYLGLEGGSLKLRERVFASVYKIPGNDWLKVQERNKSQGKVSGREEGNVIIAVEGKITEKQASTKTRALYLTAAEIDRFDLVEIGSFNSA